MMKKETIHKVVGIIVLISIVLITMGYLIHRSINLTDIRDYVASYGNWAPFILLLMIILASSVGFIFQIPVAVAGLLLDTPTAIFISISGLTIGALISFSIARLFRSYAEKKFIDKIKSLEEYDEHLKKSGFLTILIFRLISIIPYELINIAGGLSRVKTHSFILATILGIIPGTIIAVYFAKTTANIDSIEFMVATIINILFAVLPLLSKRVRNIIFYSKQHK